jgi:hypothetical protein
MILPCDFIKDYNLAHRTTRTNSKSKSLKSKIIGPNLTEWPIFDSKYKSQLINILTNPPQFSSLLGFGP